MYASRWKKDFWQHLSPFHNGFKLSSGTTAIWGIHGYKPVTLCERQSMVARDGQRHPRYSEALKTC